MNIGLTPVMVYFGRFNMKKLKLISCLLAAASLFGTAAGAKFYNDFEDATIFVSKTSDGLSFVSCKDSFDTRILELDRAEDGSFIFSRGQNELIVTPGSDTAVFNGQKIKMPAAAYMSGDSICVPARFLYESFGAHVEYPDGLKFYPVINVYAGNDIQSVNGLIGDSFNNWSITLPNGYFCYTDSIDANVLTINNFKDIKLEIEMYGGDGTLEPSSTNLEDYLERTEFITGADGRRYYLSGHVYSNPTDETRAELNAVIDSFIPAFTVGARNISNISADGTKWELASFRPGVAFDIPLGWDTYDYYVGYEYGEQIHITADVYADTDTDRLLDKMRKFRVYFGLPDLTTQPYELTYNGFKVTVTENESSSEWSNRFDMNFYIENGGNVYAFTISSTAYKSEFSEIPESFKDKARESMYMILDTLRLSDPGNDTTSFDFEEFFEPQELSVGDLKFTVPGMLVQYTETDTEEDASALFVVTPDTVSGLAIIHSPGFDDNVPYDEMTEFLAETESIDINGIEFLRPKQDYFIEDPNIYDVYINLDEDIMIFLFIVGEKTDSPFAEDIESVIYSIHK